MSSVWSDSLSVPDYGHKIIINSWTANSITKLSRSPSRGKQQSTMAVPVLHQGSENSTFLSVAFACTFKKNGILYLPFFHPLHQTKQEVAVTMSTQAVFKHTSVIAAITFLFQSWSPASSAAELGRSHGVLKQSRLKTSALWKPLLDAAPTFYYQQVGSAMLPIK